MGQEGPTAKQQVIRKWSRFTAGLLDHAVAGRAQWAGEQKSLAGSSAMRQLEVLVRGMSG
tara:strand:- start:1460 stop:1639 length:180 start_codon:yes stop_codon:yes gene_type:complete